MRLFENYKKKSDQLLVKNKVCIYLTKSLQIISNEKNFKTDFLLQLYIYTVIWNKLKKNSYQALV
jgi:hypothetical protein